ncbi:AAA family ATPase [Alloscardovia omnicolens]|uniref:ATP-dependent DNA helicase n=1 Tax=Alloscardovia omnicolens TaxID=419015 RepID=UPI003A5D8DA2
MAATGHKPDKRALNTLANKAWSNTRKRKTTQTSNPTIIEKQFRPHAEKLYGDTNTIIDDLATDNTQVMTRDDIQRCRVLDLAKPGLADTLAQEQHDDQLKNNHLSDHDAAHEFQRLTGEHKTTFTKAHIAATAHSLFDGLAFDQDTDRIELANTLANSMMEQFVEITPDIYQVPDQFAQDNRFTIEDITGKAHSILDMKKGEKLYATQTVIDAEKQLIDIMDGQQETSYIDKNHVIHLLDEYNKQADHPLSSDQYDAVVAALTTRKNMFAIIGPAGAGKTTTLKALTYVVNHAQGIGKVIGTAPSTRAAEEMQSSMNINCANIAAIITEETHGALRKKRDAAQKILNTVSATREQKQNAYDDYISATTQLQQYTIPENSILIVDEAGMAATTDLSLICSIAYERNTRILFVGDHMQLPAAGEGTGALTAMHDRGHEYHVELTSLFRFNDTHEAHVSIMLRNRDRNKDSTYTAISEYRAMNRIHQSLDQEQIFEQAYQDTRADIENGLNAILMAADNKTVADLNRRFTQDLMDKNLVETNPSKRVELSDGVAYGVGDHIVTRRNNSSIKTSKNEAVHNGDYWIITHIDFERKTIAVKNPEENETAILPFWYAKEHAQGGYASTIHLAQGATFDTSRLLIAADSTMNHNLLYVAMTRGKQTNDVYMQLNPVSDQDKIAWANVKEKTFINQGKKAWTLTTTNPDPEKYYTPHDLEPTEQELADSQLNTICNTRSQVFATQTRQDYLDYVHSLPSLIADRQLIQARIVSHDILTNLGITHDDYYIHKLMADYRWPQLVDAYEKAYLINPDKANHILSERVRGEMPLSENNLDKYLFTPLASGEPVAVITRKLNEISALYRGTPVLTNKNGYVNSYQPQHVSDTTQVYQDWLNQIDQKIDATLDKHVEQALAHPLPWQKNLKSSTTTINTLDRSTQEYTTLLRSTLIYRAANNITNMFSPFGQNIDYRINPGRAAWRRNLSNCMFNHKNPDKPQRYIPDHIITDNDLDIDNVTIKKETIMFNTKTYNKITSINERIYHHWKTRNTQYAYTWAKQQNIPVKYLISTGSESLIDWAQSSGISIEELAQTGLITQNNEGQWEEKYPNSVLSPIRDIQGHISAFTPLETESHTTSDTPVATDIFEPNTSLWGLNKNTKTQLSQEQPYVILAATPTLAAQALNNIQRGQNPTILTPATHTITPDHIDQIRSLAQEKPVHYTLIITGEKENDKKVLSEAFTAMNTTEKSLATVITQDNASHKTTVTDLHHDATPLWQALADVTLPEHLTRSNAVEAHKTITSDIINQLPVHMRQQADETIRHNITRQLAQQQAQQTIQTQALVAQQEQANQQSTATMQ